MRNILAILATSIGILFTNTALAEDICVTSHKSWLIEYSRFQAGKSDQALVDIILSKPSCSMPENGKELAIKDSAELIDYYKKNGFYPSQECLVNLNYSSYQCISEAEIKTDLSGTGKFFTGKLGGGEMFRQSLFNFKLQQHIDSQRTASPQDGEAVWANASDTLLIAGAERQQGGTLSGIAYSYFSDFNLESHSLNAYLSKAAKGVYLDLGVGYLYSTYEGFWGADQSFHGLTANARVQQPILIKDDIYIAPRIFTNIASASPSDDILDFELYATLGGGARIYKNFVTSTGILAPYTSFDIERLMLNTAGNEYFGSSAYSLQRIAFGAEYRIDRLAAGLSVLLNRGKFESEELSVTVAYSL